MFTADDLHRRLHALPACEHYWVAFSGGLDSTVLLHALASLPSWRSRLRAVHVNHGLQADAKIWADRCVTYCRRWHVPCVVENLTIEKHSRHGLEARARTLRYAALEKHLATDDALVTAHHLDDQAETVLLQWLRGAGPHGLAAMPACAVLSRGYHLRPLLDYTRSELAQYAALNDLDWIEDRSNQDMRFDRNFIRQRVLPLLTQRWPAAARTLSRGARLVAEAVEELDAVAADDVAAASDVDGHLLTAALAQYGVSRLKNALRFWIKAHGYLPPNEKRLHSILTDVLGAQEDRVPLVRWDGAELRRYRGALYLSAPVQEIAGGVWPWRLPEPVRIDELRVHLRAERVQGQGLALRFAQNGITLRLRRGGESVRFGGLNRKLKKLLQQAGVPPWQRTRLPLLYAGDHLVAIPGYWVFDEFRAQAGEDGYVLSLTWHD